MSNIGPGKKHDEMKSKVLHAAASLFLEKGYTNSTVKEIAAKAEINIGSLVHLFKNKENLMCELVQYVLEGQFEATANFLKGKTEDKILFYAAETTLQLYITENNEYIREMYSVAYSLPNSSEVIYHTITGKLEEIFREHLPELETKDFYELEIASGGIMRGFMTVPCDMYFTMERKVKRFLETTFLIYRVPDEKIQEAVDFVSQFDYETIAQQTIDNMLVYLESKI